MMRAMNPKPIPSAQGPSHGRQRGAAPLQAPRRTDPEQLTHQGAEVVSGHLRLWDMAAQRQAEVLGLRDGPLVLLR